MYSTGRANLPGAVTERDLQHSWRNMLPALLEHSTAVRMLAHFPEHKCGKTEQVFNTWTGWNPTDASATETHVHNTGDALDNNVDDGLDDDMLGALGL